MGTTYKLGESDDRHWGRWEVIALGRGHVVKKILVGPQGRLSLQRHEHRAEHWVIVSGEGEVTLGDDRFVVVPDQVVYVPRGATHRIANVGSEMLEFIEVQTGALLSEDDIERFDDGAPAAS